MSATSLRQRHPVKMSVTCNDFVSRLLTQPIVQVTKVRGPAHLMFSDAVNGYIEGIEIVARINKTDFRADLFAIFESHDANLANAAHTWIRGLKVDGNKAHELFQSLHSY